MFLDMLDLCSPKVAEFCSLYNLPLTMGTELTYEAEQALNEIIYAISKS